MPYVVMKYIGAKIRATDYTQRPWTTLILQTSNLRRAAGKSWGKWGRAWWRWKGDSAGFLKEPTKKHRIIMNWSTVLCRSFGIKLLSLSPS